MKTIAGLATTGRHIHGPASDLVELVDDNGFRHTAVVFHPEYRQNPAINSALSVVLGFLESPMVTGLLELGAHDPEVGAFVYPTGQCRSVAELNRLYADMGDVPGVRAGLEFMYAAGEILLEAADAGAPHGVYSHGGLTPWRLVFKKDGQVQVLGHGLPQVEILQFLGQPEVVPREDSFRYCPPERLEGQPENFSSDLFSLALVAFELMTGKPVYDGLVNDIRAMASRAEGSRRLFRFRSQLPRSVQDLLKVCFRSDMGDRHSTGAEFLEEVRRVIGGSDITGPSLMDVMARAGAARQRTGAPLDGGQTMMMSKDRLSELAGSDDDEEPARPVKQSWKPPARGRRLPPRVGASQDDKLAAAPAQPEAAAEVSQAPAEPAAPEASGDKSQKPPANARWRRPARRTAPPPEPAKDPEPEEPSPAEGEQAARQRAASLADSIVGGARRRPPRLGASGDATPPPQEGPDVSPSARPPPRRATPVREAAPPAEEPVASPPAPAPDLQAPPSVKPSLDRRLARTPPPAPPLDPDSAPDLPPPPTLPPRKPAGASPVDPQPGSEAGLVKPALGPVPASPLPEEPAHQPVVAAPEGPMPPPPSGHPLPWRSPAPLPPHRGEAASYKLYRKPGAPPLRFRAPPTVPVSEAVAWLLGSALPVRLDPAGRLAGWYRLAQGGVLLEGRTPMGDTLQDVPLELVFVQNITILADVLVEHHPPISLRCQVGLAVPACSLVDAFASMLDLPDGDWRLAVGDRLLNSHEILADLGERREPLRLVVRRS